MTTSMSGPSLSLFSQALAHMSLMVKQLAGELRKIATAAKTLSELAIPEIVSISISDREYEIAPIPDDLGEDDPNRLAQKIARKKGIKK